MNGRTVVGAGGLVVLVAALTSVVAPPVAPVVGMLGNDYFLVATFGALASLVGVAAIVSGRASVMDQATMPEPERPPSVPAAGDPFDDRVGSLQFVLPVVGAEDREAVRSRLRDAAVEAVRRADRCDRATARERVVSGEWTTDRAVTAFLNESSPSLSNVVFARRRVGDAVDAIAALEDDQ